MSDDDIDLDRDRLLAEHRALEQEHARLHAEGHVDVEAHKVHAQRLRQHMTHLHAYLRKRGLLPGKHPSQSEVDE